MKLFFWKKSKPEVTNDYIVKIVQDKANKFRWKIISIDTGKCIAICPSHFNTSAQAKDGVLEVVGINTFSFNYNLCTTSISKTL